MAKSSIAVVAVALGLCLCAGESGAKRSALEGVFGRMTRALKQKKPKLFKAQWHPRGYAKNLVGGSGIPGRGVYAQGSRKGWYLKPAWKTLRSVAKGRGYVVRCAIWSWRRKRSVDRVYALLVRHKKRWVILGAGEKRRQVLALAKKALK